jgi:hypothetical protein
MLDSIMAAEPASQTIKLSESARPSTQPNSTEERPSAAPSIHSPPLTRSEVVLTAKKSPLDTATALVEQYLQTLPFPDQQTAYRHHTVQFLRLYGEYYLESKTILKAQREESAYCTRNCTLKLNFQPRDRVAEKPAYLSLKSEISSFSEKCKHEGGTTLSPRSPLEQR